MPEYDAEIIVHPLIDKGDFERDIDRLKRLLEEKKSQIESLKSQYASYIDRISKTKEQLYLEQEITKTQKEREAILGKLYGREQLKSSELKKLNIDLEKSNIYLNKLSNDLYKVKLNPGATQSVRDLKREISTAEREADKLSNTINKKVDQAAKEQDKARWKESQERAKQLIREANAEIAERKATNDIAKRELAEKAVKRAKGTETLNNAIDKLSNSTTKFGESFKNVFGTLMSPISSVISGISALGERILRLGSYVLIFNVIRSGFRQLRDYIENALVTNTMFITSLNQVKSNLMVAFYPIYQSVLPAINTLMSILVQASSYLANFISMITGTNIKQNIAGAKALSYQQKSMQSSGASNAKSIEGQNKAYDELGKGINGTKKELASFDKLNKNSNKNLAKFDKLIVLSQEKSKIPKSPRVPKSPKVPKSDGFIFSPATAVDSTYDNMVTIFDKISKKLEPLKEKFKSLGEIIKTTIGKFALNALKDFNTEFAKPLVNWTIDKGLPEFIRITGKMLTDIKWDKLNGVLKDLWKALEPFAEHVGEGLLWVYENVLVKLATWTMNEAAPKIIESLAHAIKWLDDNIGGDNIIIGVLGAFATFKLATDVFKIITFVKDLTEAYKGLTAIEAISTALQGPAGIIGLSAAAGVAIALGVKGFSDIQKKRAEENKKYLDKMLEDLGKTHEEFEKMNKDEQNKLVNNWIKSQAEFNKYTNKLSDEQNYRISDSISKVLNKSSDMRKETLDKMLSDTGKTYDVFRKMSEKNKIELIKNWIQTQADNNRLIGTERDKFIREQTKLLSVEIDKTKHSHGILQEMLQDKAISICNWLKDRNNEFSISMNNSYNNFKNAMISANDFLNSKLKDGFNSFKDSMIRTNDFLNSKLKYGFSKFIYDINRGFNFLIGKINWVIEQLNKIHVDIPEWMPFVGGRSYGVHINKIPEGSWNIPRFAQGAVLKGGNPILAYLNDQPRGQTNIETPLNTMVQAFNEAISRSRNTYPNNIVIQADGDLAGIVNMLRFNIKKQDELIGTNYIQDGIFA